MPLENLDARNRNIRSFAITEPEKATTTPFDPNRDISALDWEGMKDYYFKLGSGSIADQPDAIKAAFQLSTLFPFRKNELQLEALWTLAIKEIQYQNGLNGLFKDEILGVLGVARSLFPTEYPQIAPKSEYLENLQDQCRKRENGIFEFSSQSSDLLWLGLVDYNRTIQETLPTLPPPSPISTKKEQMLGENGFTELLSLRVFYPDFFDQHIDQLGSMDYLRQRFENYRDNRVWVNALPIAATLAVMAAQEVKISETGLTINLAPPKLEAPVKIEMPERRRF